MRLSSLAGLALLSSVLVFACTTAPRTDPLSVSDDLSGSGSSKKKKKSHDDEDPGRPITIDGGALGGDDPTSPSPPANDAGVAPTDPDGGDDCDTFPECVEGDIEVDSEDECFDDGFCYTVEGCGFTIVCTGF